MAAFLAVDAAIFATSSFLSGCFAAGFLWGLSRGCDLSDFLHALPLSFEQALLLSFEQALLLSFEQALPQVWKTAGTLLFSYLLP